MKTMTCKQLGGACDKKFSANTFEEMAQLSQEHGMKMYQQNDEAHIKVINEFKELMQNPNAMIEWIKGKKEEFDALEED